MGFSAYGQSSRVAWGESNELVDGRLDSITPWRDSGAYPILRGVGRESFRFPVFRIGEIVGGRQSTGCSHHEN
jgi:hypothetical protein